MEVFYGVHSLHSVVRSAEQCTDSALTVHSFNSVVHRAQFTVYSVQCTACTEQFIVCNAQFTVHFVHHSGSSDFHVYRVEVYTVQFRGVHCSVYRCTLCSVEVFTVQCSL